MEEKVKNIELMNKYEEFDRKLDKLFLIDIIKYAKLNLQDMNKWLNEVINLYAEYGYQVNYSDFYNVFKSNTSRYQKRNEIVNEYMKVFFDNRDNPDSVEFNNLMFGKFRDLEITNMNNPFLDEIKDAVIDLSNNIKVSYNNSDISLVDLLLREINTDSKDLGIGKVNRENLMDVKNMVWGKICEIKSLLNDSEEKEEMKKSAEEKLEARNKESEERKNIKVKLSEAITYNSSKKYSEMNKEQQEEFLMYLPYIADTIIKLRIFMNYYPKYVEYAKENNYLSLKGEIASNLIQSSLLENELESELVKKKRLESNNKGIGNKTKLRKVDSRIISIIAEINSLRQVNNNLKLGYLNKFYLENNLFDVFDKFDVYLDGNSDKLFGVFDFDNLELTSDIINDIECFSKFSIKLPRLDSEEFIFLSNSCLGVRDEVLANEASDSIIFSRK